MELLNFMLRIAPGAALFIVLIALIPRGAKGIRIMAYIMLFILVRDAMTPLGLWSFGTSGGFWIRFTPDGALLALLGLSSVAIVLAMYYYERELRSTIRWFTGGKVTGLAAGVTAALVIAAPLVVMNIGVPAASRGGAFPAVLLPALLAMTVGGNIYEEFLFRGYLQGYFLAKGTSNTRAALLSGIAFGFGHVFLASTVTAAGWPLLLFATWEGVILGFARMRFGLAAAATGHGLAIFILASGL